MKVMKVLALLLFAIALTLPIWKPKSVAGQAQERPQGFAPLAAATEAPTGFDTLTNGLVSQATHDGNRDVFEERDGVQKGLGPIYNAQSCAECHQNPVTGGISQISELRAGHNDGFGNFVPATLTINDDGVPGTITIANRSLINQRAICPGVVTDNDSTSPTFGQIIFNHPNEQAQERVPGAETVRTRRMTTNLLGLGYVEAIANDTLMSISSNQPSSMRGQIVLVPVAEANGALRVGRFGWKNQDASLLTFSSGAYLNEMGITNRLSPVEVTKLCDDVPDPLPNAEDPDGDIDAFAQFMRATKAPSRDARLSPTADAQVGAALFHQIGCDVCHIPSITTAPAGTVINGGAFVVPDALGNKIIHPYSDFLIHNVGTGDGIAQTTVSNGTTLDQSTKNKVRTAPLWGVRTHNELMHDGESYTRNEAILRHAGEATGVTNNYRSLSTAQKNQLVAFINSL
jgi:cytochrome c553